MSAIDEALRQEEARRQAYEDSLPICSNCDNPIGDEHYFLIDGYIYCEDCLNDEFRKRTDEYENEENYEVDYDEY